LAFPRLSSGGKGVGSFNTAFDCLSAEEFAPPPRGEHLPPSIKKEAVGFPMSVGLTPLAGALHPLQKGYGPCFPEHLAPHQNKLCLPLTRAVCYPEQSRWHLLPQSIWYTAYQRFPLPCTKAAGPRSPWQLAPLRPAKQLPIANPGR
jgi:hypothetical protein